LILYTFLVVNITFQFPKPGIPSAEEGQLSCRTKLFLIDQPRPTNSFMTLIDVIAKRAMKVQ